MCAVSAYTLAATPCSHHRHQRVGRSPRYAHGLGISPGEEDVSERDEDAKRWRSRCWKKKIHGQYSSVLVNTDVDDPKSLTELIAVAPRSLGIVR